MTACTAEQATYTFVYAGDDPVNETDPSGMLPTGCGMAGSLQYLEAHCASSPPSEPTSFPPAYTRLTARSSSR